MDDPSPRERRWYTSLVHDGQRGFLVVRGGKPMIRLDRGEHVDQCVPFDDTWETEVNYRPLSQADLAKICFQADLQVLRTHGRHQEAKRDWLSLSQSERKMWLNDGPEDEELPIREGLFDAMMDFLEYYYDPNADD